MKFNFLKNKKNSKHLVITFLILLFTFIIMLILHSRIFLSGDDYEYATYSINGFKTFIDKHIYHYNYVNGRSIIHILASVVLRYDIFLWRILNPILICLTCFFIGKVSSVSIEEESKSPFWSRLLPAVFLFLSISINISREAIYWADGTFNYLYPTLVIFCIYHFFAKGIKNSSLPFYFPIISFFACATMELTGLMCFGIIIMTVFYEAIFRKKKLQIQAYISVLFGLVGYGTVVFAPGTLNRISNKANQIWTTEKFADLMSFYLINPATILIIGLMIFSAFYWSILFLFEKETIINVKSNDKTVSNKKKKNNINIDKDKILWITRKIFFSILSASLFLVLSICLYISLNKASLLYQIDYFTLCITIICLLLISFFILAIKKDLPESFMFTLVGIGSQFLLISSEFNIYRGISPAIIVFIVPIVIFINHLYTSKNYKIYIPFVILLGYFGLTNTFSIYKGYNSNYEINLYNRNIIVSEKENPTNDKIVLKRMYDPIYTFHPPEMMEARILYMEDFYNIDNERIFIEQDMGVNPNRVFVNSQYVLCNVPPYKRGDIYFLSAGELKNQLGYEFAQDKDGNIVFTTSHGETIQLINQTNDVIIDGEYKKVSAGFYIRDGRNVIPIDFFQNYLGYEINMTINKFGGMDINIKEGESKID